MPAISLLSVICMQSHCLMNSVCNSGCVSEEALLNGPDYLLFAEDGLCLFKDRRRPQARNSGVNLSQFKGNKEKSP